MDQKNLENNMVCPFCKSKNTYIYRSIAFKIILTIIFLPAVLLFLYPKYRCRDCKKMFNENENLEKNDKDANINKDFKKKKKIITVIIVILILGIFIYKITNFVLTQINTIAQ